jgi:hypothetical protein
MATKTKKSATATEANKARRDEAVAETFAWSVAFTAEGNRVAVCKRSAACWGSSRSAILLPVPRFSPGMIGGLLPRDGQWICAGLRR